MMRGGLSAPMMNIEFYHNTDVISQTTKQKHATGMAKFMAEELRIPVDRWAERERERERERESKKFMYFVFLIKIIY